LGTKEPCLVYRTGFFPLFLDQLEKIDLEKMKKDIDEQMKK